MGDLDRQNNECCSGDSCTGLSSIQTGLQPLSEVSLQNEVCCGSPPGPQSSSLEKPGYQLLSFVEDFKDTPCGPVPRIKTKLEGSDHLGTLIARLGIKRDQYKIAPGLYCVGNPDQDSPVLVTANYKLTFDTLRQELTYLDAWVLVLDTRGINVWCAAGKALFSTLEVVHRIKQTMLKKVVNHHQLVLPQLGATGVSAHQVKKESGFK
ncbi:MAG: acetyl-CoA synthase subunit gamma, partial [Deltaproteobacteria bacterium]|nr:acetyl-CoA synthase subunit gamma [Deltaproteobacteria bacterium]